MIKKQHAGNVSLLLALCALLLALSYRGVFTSGESNAGSNAAAALPISLTSEAKDFTRHVEQLKKKLPSKEFQSSFSGRSSLSEMNPRRL